MAERVAVVGGRDYPNPGAAVDYFLSHMTWTPDSVIVSGGALGIDRAAEAWARRHLMLPPVVIRPQYTHPGDKGAPKERNWEIVSQVDRVVAFWDGMSGGTAHVIAAATRRGIPVEIHMPGDS